MRRVVAVVVCLGCAPTGVGGGRSPDAETKDEPGTSSPPDAPPPPVDTVPTVETGCEPDDGGEVLDGEDNDCDGVVDEDTDAWDLDGDCACVAPACTGSTRADCAAITGGDCDDADPANFPGNPEVCDGADNDCDGVPDDELTQLSWWPDVDGDGFGSLVATPVLTCDVAPPGTVANNADCDDQEANVRPFRGEIECDALDNDCDPTTPDGADRDHDGVTHCFDCDDSDPNRSPALEEVCNDRDDDCDGDADDGLDFDEYWPDRDGDGYGDEDADEIELCEDVRGWVDNDDDCNDRSGWINPSAVDWPCDGIDSDCEHGDSCP